MGFLLNLFGGNSLGMYLAIALAVVVLMSGIAIRYELHEIENKQTQITALTISNAEQKKAIDQMAADTKHIQEIDNTLTTIERSNNASAAKLSDTLQKLKDAATKNPAAVEKAINKASNDRNRCLALVTGAAKGKKETNRLCPQVIERK